MLSRLFVRAFPWHEPLHSFHSRSFSSCLFFFSVRLTACWVRNVEHKKPLADNAVKLKQIWDNFKLFRQLRRRVAGRDLSFLSLYF